MCMRERALFCVVLCCAVSQNLQTLFTVLPASTPSYKQSNKETPNRTSLLLFFFFFFLSIIFYFSSLWCMQLIHPQILLIFLFSLFLLLFLCVVSPTTSLSFVVSFSHLFQHFITISTINIFFSSIFFLLILTAYLSIHVS